MDYRARFYDPTIGRFVQPDSVIPNYADPQGLNRYSYVRNSPLIYSDPTGHFIVPLLALFIIGAVALAADNHIATPSDPGSVRQQIEEIKRQTNSDAQALIGMFTSNKIPGSNASTRLDTVLNATSDGSYTHFAVNFGDSGFKEEYRDPWPAESGNQVGHFLTAVDIGCNANNALGISAIVGHEMTSDRQPLSTAKQIFLGATNPWARNEFIRGTDDAFENILAVGGPLYSRTGNSIQDLRLSYAGWTLGKQVCNGTLKSNADVARWLSNTILAR